mmetsp:Transcript_5059/g.6547  ORF Transcript_5059/g.6547 Transcript_5059/m.6547 type:complete len:620 (-) Transcript_5059:111-1970(-)
MTSLPNAVGTDESWQSSVSQKQRNDMISSIATELANLEPSATMQSKLGLASKLESTIFAKAKDINDYHKTVAKRLKKVRKVYSTNAAPISNVDPEKRKQEEIIQKKQNLRMQCGDNLKIIVENGKNAAIMMNKLETHIDKAILDGVEIGVIPIEKAISVKTGTRGNPLAPPHRTIDETLHYLIDLEKDNKLEKSTRTVREWVLKCAKENLFFGEKIDHMVRNILLNTDVDNSDVFFRGMKNAMEEAGLDVATMSTPDIIERIKQNQEKIRKTVPIERNKEDEKTNSLIYLDKVRAASEVCLLYCSLPPEEKNAKFEYATCAKTANDVVFDSLERLQEIYKENNQKSGEDSSQEQSNICLEDAWNKVLEYDKDLEENIVSSEDVGVLGIDEDTRAPDKKKLRISSLSSTGSSKKGKPLSIRSKILLVGGRKPPSNLLDALKRKQAILSRGTGAYSPLNIRLEFGESFEMTIYFAPLLVSIRALVKGTGTKDEKEGDIEKFRKRVIHGGFEAWKSPLHGLHSRTSTKMERSRQRQQVTQQQYQVMGFSGDFNMVGPLIAKRLEYASAQATKCLRRCFADLASKPNSSDFETEIMEGNALLKFLNLARHTYCPNWVDADLDD